MTGAGDPASGLSGGGFELLYRRGPCLVVSKPGGVATQAPPGVDSLETRVLRRLRAARPPGHGPPYLAVLHRLDRPASGALLLATSRRAARRLSWQFESRLIQKTYWALVQGVVRPAAGSWRDWLRKRPDEARVDVVEADAPGARLAVLHYRVLAGGDTWSLLEVDLETGRTHQIRVQAASRGHPVWGDLQYGAQTTFGPADADPRRRWIALHARSLAFRHPKTGDFVSVAAPLPEPWRWWAERRKAARS